MKLRRVKRVYLTLGCTAVSSSFPHKLLGCCFAQNSFLWTERALMALGGVDGVLFARKGSGRRGVVWMECRWSIHVSDPDALTAQATVNWTAVLPERGYVFLRIK
jgi:hypothetical protein